MRKKLKWTDVSKLQSYPLRLPIIKFTGKDYTIDPRLKEFRFIQYGKKMEFIPFSSVKGQKMLRKLKKVV